MTIKVKSPQKVGPVRPHSLVFNKPSRTHQSFKSECDINQIMRKFETSGSLTHTNNRPPAYGDFATTHDYQSSVNLVMSAQQAFNELPSALRAQFANDPGLFLDFIYDPNNAEEIKKLGLTKTLDTPQRPSQPAPEPESTPSTITPDTPASPPS